MRFPSGSWVGLMKSVAPNFLAQDSLFGLVSIAMMRLALTKAAVLMTPRPIAPQPKTATLEPAFYTRFSAMQHQHDSVLILTDTLLLDNCTPCSCDSTSKKANLFKRGALVDSYDRNICNNGVLRKCRCAHLYWTCLGGMPDAIFAAPTKW